MERLFENLDTIGFNGDRDDYSALDDYEAKVKALIADAVDYSLSSLSPEREENLKYYYGMAPGLDVDASEVGYSSSDESSEQHEPVNKSTVVSTDVRDTVMAIMPSLMRIFTSSDDIVDFIPSTPENDDGAKQAKLDALYTFNEENDGFLILHNVFKDALIEKIGVVEWWSDEDYCVKFAEYQNIEEMQLRAMLEEYEAGNTSGEPRAEIVEQTPVDANGIIAKVLIRHKEITPVVRVRAVPPEDFRIDRRARSIKESKLVGSASIVPTSDVIAQGFPKELVYQYTGQYDYFTAEREIYHPDIDMAVIDRDMVEFGRYFIMIDQDGDGIDELHYITTLGTNYDIVEDELVDAKRMALFCGDPRPHTAIGDAMADLVKDIQEIRTQLLRGALDSLSASMFADLAVNENMANMDDVLSDGIGRVIRTRGDPAGIIREFRPTFVGAEVFEMMGQMDMLRQRRTGISEASKGVDPKALQSTNLMGIEAIVSGAQERTELIARIFAETGFKHMMEGIFRELVRKPNRNRTIHMQGKWVNLRPSLYDPKMTVRVNPSLGKGSDMTRLMALQSIQQSQEKIMTQMGLVNPIVTPEQYLNTVKDQLAIVNIKNTARYFNDITPEIMESMSGPKEPSPEEIVARSTMEEVKAKVVKIQADQKINSEKLDFERQKFVAQQDLERDKLGLMALIQLATSIAEHPATSAALPEAEKTVDERNQGL